MPFARMKDNRNRQRTPRLMRATNESLSADADPAKLQAATEIVDRLLGSMVPADISDEVRGKAIDDLAQKLPDVPRSGWEAYARTIIKRRSIDVARRRSLMSKVRSTAVGPSGSEPQDDSISREQLAAIRKVLADLSDDDLAVVRAVIVQGESLRGAAAALGMALATASRRLSAALARMRNAAGP